MRMATKGPSTMAPPSGAILAVAVVALEAHHRPHATSNAAPHRLIGTRMIPTNMAIVSGGSAYNHYCQLSC